MATLRQLQKRMARQHHPLRHLIDSLVRKYGPDVPAKWSDTLAQCWVWDREAPNNGGTWSTVVLDDHTLYVHEHDEAVSSSSGGQESSRNSSEESGNQSPAGDEVQGSSPEPEAGSQAGAESSAQPEAGPEAGEYRPKNTSEVAPSSGSGSGDVHGGDGRSYEVAHQSAAPADGHGGGVTPPAGEMRNRPETAGQQSQPNSAGQQTGSSGKNGDTTSTPASAAQQTNSAADTSPKGETTEAEDGRSLPESDGARNSDSGQFRPPVEGAGLTLDSANQGGDAPDRNQENPGGEDFLERSEEELENQDTGTQGGGAGRSGAHYRLSDLKRAARNRSLAKRVNSALLVWADKGQGERSQKWDYVKFALAAKTKQSIETARRDDEETPPVMVLVDVSGSCLGFAPRAMTVLASIMADASIQPKPVVVFHSNGWPAGVIDPRGNSIAVPWINSKTRAIEWYLGLARKYQSQAFVAIGDADAEDIYIALAKRRETVRFAWLDNYRCRTSPVSIDPKWRQSSKAVRVIGCNLAEDVVTALEIAATKL